MNIAIKDTSLEDILRRIEAGEHVTLTRDGKPVAEVEPAERTAGALGSLSRVGAFRDTEFWMAEDFDELGPEWDEYVK
jgi:antitoxin (DNA-binding transcriptional repressor) of toxin-antitoxin stability system